MPSRHRRLPADPFLPHTHTHTNTWCRMVHPDGRRIICGCKDGSLRVFEAESGEQILDVCPTLPLHPPPVLCPTYLLTPFVLPRVCLTPHTDRAGAKALLGHPARRVAVKLSVYCPSTGPERFVCSHEAAGIRVRVCVCVCVCVDPSNWVRVRMPIMLVRAGNARLATIFNMFTPSNSMDLNSASHCCCAARWC